MLLSFFLLFIYYFIVYPTVFFIIIIIISLCILLFFFFWFFIIISLGILLSFFFFIFFYLLFRYVCYCHMGDPIPQVGCLTFLASLATDAYSLAPLGTLRLLLKDNFFAFFRQQRLVLYQASL